MGTIARLVLLTVALAILGMAVPTVSAFAYDGGPGVSSPSSAGA